MLSGQNESFLISDDLSKIIENCCSGDTILVYNGTYKICEENTRDSSLKITDLDIRIIGVEDNVIFSNCNIQMSSSSVHIQNINIIAAAGDLYEGHLCVENKSSLWLNHCKIKYEDICVYADKLASLYVKDCIFYGTEAADCAIYTTLYSKFVNIVNSTFIRCGSHSDLCYDDLQYWQCICIAGSRCFDDISVTLQPSLKLICIGNTFDDNYGYPIAKYCSAENNYLYTDEIPEWFIHFDATKHVLLNNNTLKGFNGLFGDESVRNANVVYSCVDVYGPW